MNDSDEVRLRRKLQQRIVLIIVLAMVLMPTVWLLLVMRNPFCFAHDTQHYFQIPVGTWGVEERWGLTLEGCTHEILFYTHPNNLDSFVATTLVKQPLKLRESPPNTAGSGVMAFAFVSGGEINPNWAFGHYFVPMLSGMAEPTAGANLIEQKLYIDIHGFSGSYVIYLSTKVNWL